MYADKEEIIKLIDRKSDLCVLSTAVEKAEYIGVEATRKRQRLYRYFFLEVK